MNSLAGFQCLIEILRARESRKSVQSLGGTIFQLITGVSKTFHFPHELTEKLLA